MTMYKGVIYRAINKINGKSYIGKSIDFERRYKDHMRASKYEYCVDHNSVFHRAIRKYGEDNFEWVILHSISDKDKTRLNDRLNSLEIESISFYDTYPGKYNMTKGGDGNNGIEFTEEYRKKLSLAQKGKKKPRKNYTPKPKPKKEKIYKNALYQYSLDGLIINKWNNINQAAQQTSIPKASIWRCCNGKAEKAGDFLWGYCTETIPDIPNPKIKKERVSRQKTNPAKKIREKAIKKPEEAKIKFMPKIVSKEDAEINKTKPIIQYTLDSKFVRKWANSGYAAKEHRLKGKTIIFACDNHLPCANFLWRYYDDEITIADDMNKKRKIKRFEERWNLKVKKWDNTSNRIEVIKDGYTFELHATNISRFMFAPHQMTWKSYRDYLNNTMFSGTILKVIDVNKTHITIKNTYNGREVIQPRNNMSVERARRTTRSLDD